MHGPNPFWVAEMSTYNGSEAMHRRRLAHTRGPDLTQQALDSSRVVLHIVQATFPRIIHCRWKLEPSSLSIFEADDRSGIYNSNDGAMPYRFNLFDGCAPII